VRFGNPHGRAQIRGLDEHGEGQARQGGGEVEVVPHHGNVVHNGQHPFHTDTFHHLLVHGDGGTEHARAHIGKVGEFQQSLDSAVLAKGAVEDREHDVDIGMRPRLRQNRVRVPPAFFVDEVLADFIARGVEPAHDRLGGANRDFMFAAPPAVEYGHA